MSLHHIDAKPEATDSREELARVAAQAVKAPISSISVHDRKTLGGAMSGLFNDYAPLGYQLPFEMLDYIELIARYNPDYSQAVSNAKTLANAGHELFVDDRSKRRAQRIKSRLEEKARLIQEGHGGVDGLIEKLLDQATTFGAMCGEWVLNEDLTDVVNFVDLNPKVIRFFFDVDEQRWVPFQKVSYLQAKEAKDKGQEVRGSCIRLNENTFVYFAFDSAPSSPYGTPPFLAALANIAIQRDMVYNMAQIVKKVGLLGIIDVTVEQLKKSPGETDEQFVTRATSFLSQYREVAENMFRDGGIVHFDDVDVQATNVSGNAAGATNIFKQNEELIFSGLKSMPSVQGRCVVPSTRVLTADLEWVPAGCLDIGEELIGFDEDLGKGRGRGASTRMKGSFVEANQREVMRCVKVITDKGTITVTREHPIVAIDRTQGRVWRQAADLKIDDKLVWFGAPWEEDRSYDAGYLAGMCDGEATIGFHGSGKNGQIAFAQNDGIVLDETLLTMKRLGFEGAVSTGRSGDNGNCAQVKLLGGQYETMRLLGQVRPHRLLAKARRVWESATLRRGGSINKTAKQDAWATVTGIVDVGEKEVVVLQTSSRTFIAEGLLNHNSYSTTETYAGVAYDIIIRNTYKYQRAVKRVIERGYFLMATMWGDVPDKIKLSFHDNKTLHRLQNAQAERIELQNSTVLWIAGLIDQAGFGQRHGFSTPKEEIDEVPEALAGFAGAKPATRAARDPDPPNVTNNLQEDDDNDFWIEE